MEKFIESGPSQALLLPVDLREWVPADDLSHFVLAAVERVPMHRFRVNERGSGSAQYHPRDDAGIVDLLLRERGVWFSAHRAGDLPETLGRATSRPIPIRTTTRYASFAGRTLRRWLRVSCRCCCWPGS